MNHFPTETNLYSLEYGISDETEARIDGVTGATSSASSRREVPRFEVVIKYQ